jgi:hypothetical protein
LLRIAHLTVRVDNSTIPFLPSVLTKSSQGRLETKLDKAVGDRLATIQDTLCEIKARSIRVAEKTDASHAAGSTQQTLGKVKAHITRTAEKPGINVTSSTTKASDANDAVPGHKENGENGTTSIQPTPAPPVQKSKGSTTATTLPAEDAGPAHKRKRNDEAEDGAVLPPKSAKLSDEQKQELGKNLPLYSLLQTALERIIPCDGL